MKSSVWVTLVLAAFVLGAPLLSAQEQQHGEHRQNQTGKEATHEHQFKYPEFEKFHAILAPVWHDYYPKQDWTKIRAQFRELTKRKEAIMKIKFAGEAKEQEALEAKRRNFGAAVDEVVKAGSDEALRKSVPEMHERFEELFEAVK